MNNRDKIFNIKTFHVLQDYKTRLWNIKVDLGKEILGTFQTRDEAVEKAMEILKADKSSQKRLIIRKPGGSWEKIINE